MINLVGLVWGREVLCSSMIVHGFETRLLDACMEHKTSEMVLGGAARGSRKI